MLETVSTTSDILALVHLDDGSWLRFGRPSRIFEARRPEEVGGILATVDRECRERGQHAVGFVGYEAGEAFGQTVSRSGTADPPLVWFAMFEPTEASRASTGSDLLTGGPYDLGALAPSFDRPRFNAAFERIKTHLAEGDSYQVNLTFQMEGAFSGDAQS